MTSRYRCRISFLLFLVVLLANFLTGCNGADQTVTGSPTISPKYIDKILSNAGSPAAGTGQWLYFFGLRYGIDPVYALAFFQKESSFGTRGVAVSTHSLGNIRSGPNSYQSYPSYIDGYEAWYSLIKHGYVEQRKLTTVGQIVPVYAPSVENDSDKYITDIENAVSNWRSEYQSSLGSKKVLPKNGKITSDGTEYIIPFDGLDSVSVAYSGDGKGHLPSVQPLGNWQLISQNIGRVDRFTFQKGKSTYIVSVSWLDNTHDRVSII